MKNNSYEQQSIDELVEQIGTSTVEGLSEEEAKKRLEINGLNELKEKNGNHGFKFL